jgi:hypothetical protein
VASLVPKDKRNQHRKTEGNRGRKSSRKKSQKDEEGRRVFSESLEENPAEEDPILNRHFCGRSISPAAGREGKVELSRDRLH